MYGRPAFVATFILALSAGPSVAAEALTVDFERQIMGLLGKTGCASGSCHGSFQGKGNFRLSLFGYEPERDFLAIARESQGRRVDLQRPDSSLLLLKATGQVEHGGGKRFDRNSWQYQMFRDWISQGATWEKGSGTLTHLRVAPSEIAFRKPGESVGVTVLGTFANGRSEDLTPLCDIRVNDDAVAQINSARVQSVRSGDTTLVVSYRGQVVPVHILVPAVLPSGTVFPKKLPEANFIDTHVFAKLKRLNMPPAPRSDDYEFLRRVTIDTIGTLPTPEEIRAFVADRRADKRARKIEELLAHPMHAAVWATKFSDITGNNTDAMENPQATKSRRSQMWHDWLRKRLASNMPYDQMIHDILCATSRDGRTGEEYIDAIKVIDEKLMKGFVPEYADKKTLDLFWRRQTPVGIEVWGEKAAAAFLGIRLECAQCHKHPFDRWTQVDYRAFANTFSQVVTGVGPDIKKAADAINTERKGTSPNNNNVILVREVYLGRPVVNARRGLAGTLPHPDTGAPLNPQALGGPELKPESGKDLREALFAWMRDKNNPFFAKSLVNRVWGHYLGAGIVDPVDDFSLANAPSNPALLDALAAEFLKSDFDFRHMERLVLNSNTYQLSSRSNSANKLDERNHSHAMIRPMMAEVVVDVLSAATGVPEKFGNDAPPDSRAIEVGSSRLNGTVSFAMRIFGRPPRSTACDCERSMEPALPQKLFLMADPGLQSKIMDPNNRLKALLKSQDNDSKALEELFLATVSRLPTENETKAFAAYRAKAPDRRTAFVDTMWALVNTTEFIFNH